MVSAIKFLAGAMLIVVGVYFIFSAKIPWIEKHFNFTSMEMATYIMITANIVMIFLMLVTISATEKSTKEYISAVERSSSDQIKTYEDTTREMIKSEGEFVEKQVETIKNETTKQIRSMERWSNIKRKQLLKSLIEELNHNVILYNQFIEDAKKNKFSQKFNNFILVSMEKCLSDSPVDNEDINHNILVLYYIIKIHDNKIIASRTPNITEESLKGFIKSIVDDYEKDKWLFEQTIKMVKEYEQNIKVEAKGLEDDVDKKHKGSNIEETLMPTVIGTKEDEN